MLLISDRRGFMRRRCLSGRTGRQDEKKETSQSDAEAAVVPETGTKSGCVSGRSAAGSTGRLQALPTQDSFCRQRECGSLRKGIDGQGRPWETKKVRSIKPQTVYGIRWRIVLEFKVERTGRNGSNETVFRSLRKDRQLRQRQIEYNKKQFL